MNKKGIEFTLTHLIVIIIIIMLIVISIITINKIEGIQESLLNIL